jgi:hypothetical protein
VFERDRELEMALAAPGVPIRYLPIGKRDHNLSITALSARRYPLDKNSSEILLELRNGTARTQEVQVALYGDGEPLKSEHLDLAPGQRLRRFFRQVFGIDAVLEARLNLSGGGRDDLAADDRAFAALPERRKARVLCVSEGNLYLEAALLLDEYLEVREIAPADYPGNAEYDLVVFDRFVPERPPGVPAVYLYPSGDGKSALPLQVVGSIERPFFEKLERGHPLLRWTALGDVNVAEALRVRPERDDRVVAADRKGPLLVTGARAGQRFVAFTFDIRKSDLPMRVAWPVLLLNSIGWLLEERDGLVAGYRAGESYTIPLPGEIAAVAITGPDGETHRLQAAAGGFVFAPERSGIYVRRAGGHETILPVNPDCDGLDDIAPLPHLRVAGRKASAPAPTRRDPRERPWVYLVLAALALLVIDWFTYHRRWTV